jgi:hypothetical protein
MKVHPELEKSPEYVGFILWAFLISQILITNLIMVIVCGIVLTKLKINFFDVMKVQFITRYKRLTIMVASLLLFSILCGVKLSNIL